jgi:lambda family phage portal protein
MWIERALAGLAPRWAAERLRARIAVDALARHYEGAQVDRRTRHWRTPARSANADIIPALHRLRNRSRDLVRNNPYASAGLDMIVAYQVGTGIEPRSATGVRALDDAANRLWREWVDAADLEGGLDLYGLMALAARTRAEAGEALVWLEQMPAASARARALPVPLQIRLLEPDYIDTTHESTVVQPDRSRIRAGVEIDGNGRARAYFLHPEHPGEITTAVAPRAERIDAARLLHLFRRIRPGQIRGVPDLAPVMSRLRQLDEYEEAAIEQAKVQACLGVFVTSPAGPAQSTLGVSSVDETGRRDETLAPGMIGYLSPGEDVQVVAPSGAGGFSEFARHQLMAVAAGFGLTYDLLTGDLTQANYSSLRAGRQAFRRRLEAAQWQMLIPGLCEPLWNAFIRAAQLAGRLPPRAEAWRAEWHPPRLEFVDPLKDAQAEVMMVRAGLKTMPQALAELGRDPVAHVAEAREWNERVDDAGLILDSDPRRTARTGTAHDAAQNAAVEIAATGAAAPPAEDPAPDAAEETETP